MSSCAFFSSERSAITFIIAVTCLIQSAGAQQAIIIDHKCTHAEAIPQYWLEQAKLLTLHYAHTSHGGQITSGLAVLESQHGRFSYALRASSTEGLPAIENPPALRIYDGNGYLQLGVNDNCDYSGGNWAAQWCNAHPGNELCASCSCAHSQAINCNVKARAFWWMMARLAGWSGPPPADLDEDGFVSRPDLELFLACATGPKLAYDPDHLPAGCTLVPDGSSRIGADFDNDGDVDQDDFGRFQRCFAGPTTPPDPACAE